MPPNPPFASKNDFWTICDGLFAMPLPPGWRYAPNGYADGHFELPTGHTLSCEVQSFEAPEAIGETGLAPFACEEGLEVPLMPDSDVIGNVIMLIRPAQGETPPTTIWRTLDVLGSTHVRVARFALASAPGDGIPDTDILGAVSAAINQGQFADYPVPLDRVAPTTELKRITPWGRIHIRVPEFWRYERAEDGRFVCDVLPDQAPPDPTLWFDYDQFSAPSNKAELDQKLREAAVGFAATLGSPDQVQVTHDADGTWIESVAHGEEDGTPLIFYNMHRHVAGDGCFIVAHFNLVLTAEDAQSPAGQQLIDLMHREIHNAIVLPMLPGEEAGSAKS